MSESSLDLVFRVLLLSEFSLFFTSLTFRTVVFWLCLLELVTEDEAPMTY